MPLFPWSSLFVTSTISYGLFVLGFIQKHGNKIFLTRGNTECSLGCDATSGGVSGWQGPSLPVWLCGKSLWPWAGGNQGASDLQGSKEKVFGISSARWQGQERSSEVEECLCQEAELLGGGTRLSGSLAKCLRELVTWHCFATTHTPSATSRPQAQPQCVAALQSKAAN